MSGEADWSIAVGILTFIVAICVAIFYYQRYKKSFLVVFIASIATYVFSVFYAWDVYDPNKNWVLFILVVSTILMMALGKYFSNIKLTPAKIHTSLKEKGRKEK